MWLQLAGKILETMGAILIAYVGLRAMVIELTISRPLRREARAAGESDIERLQADLETALDRRNRQFGFYEALLVGGGTALVALGCGVYLAGMLTAPH